MRVRVLKSRDDSPLASLQGAAAIAALTFGYRLIDNICKVEGRDVRFKNFEDYVEEISPGTVQRETVWVFNDLSRATVLGESLHLEEFLRRFCDLEWCDAHPDSPIANLRHLHENTNKWRQHFRAHPPMILMRRGKRTLKIRHDTPPKEKEKWLKLL